MVKKLYIAKIVSFFSFFILLSTLTACSPIFAPATQSSQYSDIISPKNDNPGRISDSGDNEMPEINVKDLFERAAKEIITLATQDPITIIKTIIEDEITVFYKNTYINDKVYYKTTATYKSLQDYYSGIFTGDALKWVLSTKFAENDKVLYCSPIGGASGWSIENTEVTIMGQIGGRYSYKAAFNRIDNTGSYETTTCQFTIEKTDNQYRISSIEYLAFTDVFSQR